MKKKFLYVLRLLVGLRNVCKFLSQLTLVGLFVFIEQFDAQHGYNGLPGLHADQRGFADFRMRVEDALDGYREKRAFSTSTRWDLRPQNQSRPSSSK